MSTKVDPLENFPTFYNMQSVSSSAVYNAIGGSQIKVYANVFTLYNSQVGSYGYHSVSIPTEISNDKVLGVYLYTSSISVSYGFQITPIYCGSGTFYMTYYKPSSWGQQSINFTFRIVYLV